MGRQARGDGKGAIPLCVCVCVRAGVGMERIGWMDVTTRRPGVCALPEFRNGPYLYARGDLRPLLILAAATDGWSVGR